MNTHQSIWDICNKCGINSYSDGLIIHKWSFRLLRSPNPMPDSDFKFIPRWQFTNFGFRTASKTMSGPILIDFI